MWVFLAIQLTQQPAQMTGTREGTMIDLLITWRLAVPLVKKQQPVCMILITEGNNGVLNFER